MLLVLQSQTKHVVYKALQRFPKGVHEVELYERVFDPNCDDSVLLELRNFIPHYQGLFYEPKTNGEWRAVIGILSWSLFPDKDVIWFLVLILYVFYAQRYDVCLLRLQLLTHQNANVDLNYDGVKL